MADRFLEARMRRQERLTREPVVQLSVVLDEAVLLRRVGDHALMHAQLERLTDLANLPNVGLRVLPLNRTIALMTESFVIMSFDPPAIAEAARLGDVVSTESLTAELYEVEADTFLYRLFFDALAKAALPQPESRQLIAATMEREWT